MNKIQWKSLTLTILILILIGSWSLTGQAEESREYQIKAGFIYNLAKFTDWPDGSFKNDTDQLVLLLYGRDLFGPAIEVIRGKLVKGRKLVVRQINRVDQLGEGHLVYISPSEKPNLKFILTALRGHPVLTVSDLNAFTQAGGMIGLVIVDERISLEINLDAVRQARLNISSQLLKLAKIVQGTH